MSVRIGTPNFAFTDASTRRPSARPGPRNDVPEVLLALSKDALKMYGTLTRRAISEIAPAIVCACASLSMTQGPAISVNGLAPPPIATGPILIGFTVAIVSGDRFGLGPLMCRFVPIRRF